MSGIYDPEKVELPGNPRLSLHKCLLPHLHTPFIVDNYHVKKPKIPTQIQIIFFQNLKSSPFFQFSE